MATSPRRLRQSRQHLLKIHHCLAVRRAGSRPGPSLSAVEKGLVPHRASHGMVSETIYLLSPPLGRELLEDFDNTCVQHPPPLLEQATVGHFVGQGVLEINSRSGNSRVS
jgi:hypothetical protein